MTKSQKVQQYHMKKLTYAYAIKRHGRAWLSGVLKSPDSECGTRAGT
jgi:hypothetical protein